MKDNESRTSFDVASTEGISRLLSESMVPRAYNSSLVHGHCSILLGVYPVSLYYIYDLIHETTSMFASDMLTREGTESPWT